jgi:hypothetical protein
MLRRCLSPEVGWYTHSPQEYPPLPIAATLVDSTVQSRPPELFVQNHRVEPRTKLQVGGDVVRAHRESLLGNPGVPRLVSVVGAEAESDPLDLAPPSPTYARRLCTAVRLG